MSRKQRKQMIEPALRGSSISRQCQLLSLSRSSFYYAPVPVSAEDLELMRLIDEQYLKNTHLRQSLIGAALMATGAVRSTANAFSV